MFLLDIIICFNSAFYDEQSELVDDRKNISYNYISGWFFVDFIAIIPFDKII